MKNNGFIHHNFRFVYKLRPVYQRVKWNVGNYSNTWSAWWYTIFLKFFVFPSLSDRQTLQSFQKGSMLYISPEVTEEYDSPLSTGSPLYRCFVLQVVYWKELSSSPKAEYDTCLVIYWNSHVFRIFLKSYSNEIIALHLHAFKYLSKLIRKFSSKGAVLVRCKNKNGQCSFSYRYHFLGLVQRRLWNPQLDSGKDAWKRQGWW